MCVCLCFFLSSYSVFYLLLTYYRLSFFFSRYEKKENIQFKKSIANVEKTDFDWSIFGVWTIQSDWHYEHQLNTFGSFQQRKKKNVFFFCLVRETIAIAMQRICILSINVFLKKKTLSNMKIACIVIISNGKCITHL